MATTTNYGWTTPDDTALVKDGASAIRSLGSSIDSTLKTQIDAQIPKTIVDAKGDLIAATAADVVARVPVGTNGQVLTADSTASAGLAWTTPSSSPLTTKGDLFTYSTTNARLGVGANGQYLVADSTAATGLKWQTLSVGGDNWVLISSQSVSAVSSVSFTGLTGYKKLFLTCSNFWGSAATNVIYYRLNADSGSNYLTGSNIRISNNSRNQSGQNTEIIANLYTATSSNADRNSIGLLIEGCNGGGYKPYSFIANGYNGSAGDAYVGNGVYNSTSNISSINITLSAGTLTSSSGLSNQFDLWGVA